MVIRIKVPRTIRGFSGGESEIKVYGYTVAEAMNDLEKINPIIFAFIFDRDGKLYPYIEVLVNGQPLCKTGFFSAKIRENDLISIRPVRLMDKGKERHEIHIR